MQEIDLECVETFKTKISSDQADHCWAAPYLVIFWCLREKNNYSVFNQS